MPKFKKIDTPIFKYVIRHETPGFEIFSGY